MKEHSGALARERWARLRFSIIASLLASPPEAGALRAAIEELAKKSFVHPTTAERIRFGASTIERWYYQAKDQPDPISALSRKVHGRAGKHPTVGVALGEAIRSQYQQHPRWTWKLH